MDIPWTITFRLSAGDICVRGWGGRYGVVDGKVDCAQRLLLYDLTQIKKIFHAQPVTTILVET